jgi:hypothetical protein
MYKKILISTLCIITGSLVSVIFFGASEKAALITIVSVLSGYLIGSFQHAEKPTNLAKALKIIKNRENKQLSFSYTDGLFVLNNFKLSDSEIYEINKLGFSVEQEAD